MLVTMTPLNRFKSFSCVLIFAEFLLLFFLIKESNANAAKNSQICVRIPPVGSTITADCSTFGEFLRSTKIYIDKTALITEFVGDVLAEKTVNMITFPRRFGKSMNLLMLRHFFEIEVYPNGSRVAQKTTRSYNFFTSGKILDEYYETIGSFTPLPLISDSRYEGIVRRHLAQYPVVYVEFKGLDASLGITFEKFLSRFGQKISNTFEDHRYLLQDLNEEESETFKNVVSRKSVDEKELSSSIIFLSKALKRKFSKDVIIIIDEYDTLLNNVYLSGDTSLHPDVQVEIEYFYLNFLRSSLLDNKAYIQCYLSGIIKLKNAGIFSNLNFLQYYTSSTPEMNKYYGISREDAAMLFDFFKIEPENRIRIQDFYDGYVYPTGAFPKYRHYYNVFSLLNYFRWLRSCPQPIGYWSGSGIIHKHLRQLMVVPCVRERLQKLILEDEACLEMGAVPVWDNDYFTFTLEDFQTLNKMLKNPESFEEAALTRYVPRLLLATGYLSFDERRNSSDCFKFPNEEVKRCIAGIFSNHFLTIFTPEYKILVKTFDRFLFDNESRSFEFEKAFERFVVANKARLIPHFGNLRWTTLSNTLASYAIEVNEAFFAQTLGFAMIGAKSFSSSEDQKYFAFEKIAEGGKIDIYAHNYKRQAIIELKYKESHYNVASAIKQASKYRAEFKLPTKFIGILGFANGSIEAAARFDWAVS